MWSIDDFFAVSLRQLFKKQWNYRWFWGALVLTWPKKLSSGFNALLTALLYLSSYPGYSREPHWYSMGLPEISRVSRQLCTMMFHSIVCYRNQQTLRKLPYYLFILQIVKLLCMIVLSAVITRTLVLLACMSQDKTISMTCCPACRTTLIATRFRVAVICPIIQVPRCIKSFLLFCLICVN